MALTQATYLGEVLGRYSITNSEKGCLTSSHGIYLSKQQSPQTPQEKEMISQIPYAFAIRSLMHAMLSVVTGDLLCSGSGEQVPVKLWK